MDLSSNDEFEVGSQIAPHLTVRAVLGEGGMARVYEAHHARLNAPVAVKVLSLLGEQARLAAERLVREAHICARLEDPRIPRIFDVSTLQDGRPFMVMERLRGPTLHQQLDEGPLSVAVAIRLACELLRVLSVVHAEGIVHRDVKPANLILQRVDGELTGIKLMDFGIAHVRRTTGSTPSLTVQAPVLGTPGYMAPEQVDSDSVDGRADLYSVGVVLYEMLLADSPFDDLEPMALLAASVSQDVPDVRRRLPSCPRGLARVIRRATHRDRARRFQSAAEFIDALDGLETTTPKRRRPWRAGTVLVLGAVLATALWLFTGGAEPSRAAPSPRAALQAEQNEAALKMKVEDATEVGEVDPRPADARELTEQAPVLDEAVATDAIPEQYLAEEAEEVEEVEERAPDEEELADLPRERFRRRSGVKPSESLRATEELRTVRDGQPQEEFVARDKGRLVSDYVEQLERLLQGDEPRTPSEVPAAAKETAGDALPPNPF